MLVETVIVWFRRDLRLHDNIAWAKAVETGNCVIPLFICPDAEDTGDHIGKASGWWLHHALQDLSAQLEALGVPLVLRRGEPVDCLKKLIHEIHPQQVFWNRCYEPGLIRQEQQVQAFLQGSSIAWHSSNSVVLVEPEKVLNKQGEPYKVYSAFARAWAGIPFEPPAGSKKPACGNRKIPGVPLDELHLHTGESRSSQLSKNHDPTRRGAVSALDRFLESCLESYAENRDIPAIDGTSNLSAALHWGQIGPREILQKVQRQPRSAGKSKFVNELAWREFAFYILYHFPYTVEGPFRREFRNFPWRDDGPELAPWQQGRTGYPLVDAGMRQLAATGLVHNRVRMLVASFLVKHLMISWRTGARWFFENLVDADLANNTLGWQWVAGCGVDAAPYFRIFNPVTQGKKFDSKGTYIRKYVPELKNVPDAYLHEPWLMPETVQRDLGCIIGADYPEPVCGLMEGRIRAMSAWTAFNHPNQQTLDL